MAGMSYTLGRVRGYAADRWYLRALLGAAFVSVLLILVIVWIESAGSRTDQRVAVGFLINLVAVLGVQVFMGNSGVPSFGHVAFVGIGAYTAAILTTPPERKASDTLIPDAPSFLLNAEFALLPALAVALAVVALVAVAFGGPIVRLRGGSAAIATLAVLVIVRTIIGNWEDITRGPKTWSGIPDYTTVWIALGFAVAAVFIARLFRESGIGLRLRATRTDELASSAVGVSIARARMAAWMLSAVIAGAAGVLYAGYFLSLAPQTFFFDLTFLYIVMVIVGGSSVSGAVVGAAAVTLITEFVRRGETGGLDLGLVQFDQLFGLTTIVLGLLVLLIMILRPEGILGRWELDDWLGRGVRRVRRARGADVVTATGMEPEPSDAGTGEAGDGDVDEAGVRGEAETHHSNQASPEDRTGTRRRQKTDPKGDL